MTTGQDLTFTFTVDRTPEEAFAAIVDPRAWWSENIEGTTDQVGAEWIYHNEPVHMTRFRVTEIVPGRRVAWHVLENQLSFVEDQSEWVGNDIVFDIDRDQDQTRVTFTQIGLVPAYECYEICRNAWSGYIKGSLRALISVGKGSPVVAL